MVNKGLLLTVCGLTSAVFATPCTQTVYLTFDTGSQSQASFIADTLRQHGIKATFFLANEKTVKGDYSLDPAWAGYWRALVADGHAFGTHTFDHVYLKNAATPFSIKPQFGAQAGKLQSWSATQYCAELKRTDAQFKALTGRNVDALWRAPGGHVSPHSLAMGAACGYQHVGWAAAGFSGDELSSEAHSNAALLQKSLSQLKDGDVFMAHLGIWSRKDPWAPAVLKPLIEGLKAKGTCFATLKSHPQFGSGTAIQTALKFK